MHNLQNKNHQSIKSFSTLLFAKKKSKTLISDDFLASFTEEIADEVEAPIVDESSIDQKQNKKKKKKGAENVNSKELEKNPEIEEVLISVNNDAIDADNNNLSIETQSDVIETVEQRARRERPPSRVRFAETSQPGFVMMGLEQISLAFGNEEVLVNISFSVSTGERVGLVGPNGSGKQSS